MMSSKMKRNLRSGRVDNSDQVPVAKGFLQNEDARRRQNDRHSLTNHWKCLSQRLMDTRGGNDGCTYAPYRYQGYVYKVWTEINGRDPVITTFRKGAR
jgi:hypothetical protein